MGEGDPEQGVQLSEIRANVENVQEKMQTNVQMMVDRGEQINNLDDKSQELQGSVNTFQRQAKALELQTRIQRCKFMAVVSCVSLYLLIILIKPDYWFHVTLIFGVVFGILYAVQKYILAKLEADANIAGQPYNEFEDRDIPIDIESHGVQ